ncbi:hypothetical protein [Kribbella sp. CA-294648]|uniref:hypothetical protein n=1 Tax=Kribbella sp. CA-294648 TaxID=3239948 RepID=UPI003D94C6C0
MNELLLTIASILVPIAGCIALYRYFVTRAKRRLAARAAAAVELGWDYGDPDLELAAVAVDIFGHWGEAHVTFTGEHNGHSFRLFDYTYVTRSGKSTRINEVHMVVVDLPVALPRLVVDKDQPVLRTLGVPDLELESNAFNKNFWVQGPDDRFSSAVLHPQMMEWMLRYPDVTWRIENHLLISPGRDYWTIIQALQDLDCLTGVVDRLPPFVLTDYGKPID